MSIQKSEELFWTRKSYYNLICSLFINTVQYFSYPGDFLFIV